MNRAGMALVEVGRSERAATPAALIALYGGALAQGLVVVSFPASAGVLKTLHHFSDGQYGALFLPQVAATIAGSLLGGSAAQRVGLRVLLCVGLAASLSAELLLRLSGGASSGVAFVLLLSGAALMGLGFGLTAAPLNAYPARLFRERADVALMAVHTSIGVGFSLGPFAAGALIARGAWSTLPTALAVLCSVVLGLGYFARLPEAAQAAASPAHAAASGAPHRAPAFWAFALIAVVYAFAEGTLSNWVVIFLHEDRGLAESTATLALSAFWAALVCGRLAVSALVLWLPPRAVWLTLFALVGLAFQLLPAVSGSASGLALFAFAGLACSACFPLTVALSSRRFPEHAAWVSSMMIAALMFGVGVGSFAIGPLRGVFHLSTLYRVSSLYPACALLVAARLRRV